MTGGRYKLSPPEGGYALDVKTLAYGPCSQCGVWCLRQSPGARLKQRLKARLKAASDS